MVERSIISEVGYRESAVLVWRDDDGILGLVGGLLGHVGLVSRPLLEVVGHVDGVLRVKSLRGLVQLPQVVHVELPFEVGGDPVGASGPLVIEVVALHVALPLAKVGGAVGAEVVSLALGEASLGRAPGHEARVLEAQRLALLRDVLERVSPGGLLGSGLALGLGGRTLLAGGLLLLLLGSFLDWLLLKDTLD